MFAYRVGLSKGKQRRQHTPPEVMKEGGMK